MRITAFALKRPTLIFSVFLAICAIGILSFFNINIQKLPTLPIPIFTVQTTDPGYSADNIDKNITLPLERALNALNNVNYITGTSLPGLSLIQVHFLLNADSEAAFLNTQAKLNSLSNTLPKSASTPSVSQVSLSDLPIIWVAVKPIASTLRTATHYVNNTLIDQLSSLPGVGAITSYGAIPNTVRIRLNQTRMSAMGITLPMIYAAFNAQNVNIPGGNVVNHGHSFLLNLDQRFNSAEQVSQMIVAYRNGLAIRLNQIAAVYPLQHRTKSLAYLGQTPAILLGVIRRTSANTLKVISEVKDALPRLRQMLPEGLSLSTVLSQRKSIMSDFNNLSSAIIISFFLAGLIILFFLRRVKTALVGIVIVPISLLGAVVAMNALGLSFNTLTLLSLVLLVSIVIDDAIIVLENFDQVKQNEGLPNEPIAVISAKRIFSSILTYSLCLCIVFGSIFFIKGIARTFLSSVSIIIISGVIVSFFISITLAPLLADRVLSKAKQPTTKKQSKKRLTKLFDLAWFDQFTNGYQRVIRKLLNHPILTFCAFLLLILPAFYIIPHIGRGLFPKHQNFNQLNITVRTPPHQSFNHFAQKLHQAIDAIQTNPDIKSLVTVSDATSINTADMYLDLKAAKDRKKSATSIEKTLQHSLDQVPNLEAFVRPPAYFSGQKQPLFFAITGKDYPNLLLLRNKLLARYKGYPSLGRVMSMNPPLQPEFKLIVDKAATLKAGLTTQQVSQAVALYGGEIKLGTIFPKDSTRHANVSVYPKSSTLITPKDLDKIYLFNDKGEAVPLASVAMIKIIQRPPVIKSLNSLHTLLFYSSPKSFLSQALAKVKALTLPLLTQGEHFVTHGQAQLMNSALKSIIIAILIAILLKYFVLAAQFESFSQPALLFIAQPLAVLLVVYLLWLTGIGLNLFSMVGLFLLIGIKTKNYILIISQINAYRKTTDDLKEAIIKGCAIRFRPVVMTSLAIAIAILPTLFVKGEGQANSIALGATILMGIIAATTFSMFFLPVSYYLVSKRTNKAKDE